MPVKAGAFARHTPALLPLLCYPGACVLGRSWVWCRGGAGGMLAEAFCMWGKKYFNPWGFAAAASICFDAPFSKVRGLLGALARGKELCSVKRFVRDGVYTPKPCFISPWLFPFSTAKSPAGAACRCARTSPRRCCGQPRLSPRAKLRGSTKPKWWRSASRNGPRP